MQQPAFNFIMGIMVSVYMLIERTHLGCHKQVIDGLFRKEPENA